MGKAILWLIARLVPGAAGGAAVLAILAAAILLVACQARVGGGTLEDAEASVLCGSSSSRLLPECKEFSR